MRQCSRRRNSKGCIWNPAVSDVRPGRIAINRRITTLSTFSELHSFMGFCNYYSGYVRMYAKLSGPFDSGPAT